MEDCTLLTASRLEASLRPSFAMKVADTIKAPKKPRKRLCRRMNRFTWLPLPLGFMDTRQPQNEKKFCDSVRSNADERPKTDGSGR
jgi:hypothetical protein